MNVLFNDLPSFLKAVNDVQFSEGRKKTADELLNELRLNRENRIVKEKVQKPPEVMIIFFHARWVKLSNNLLPKMDQFYDLYQLSHPGRVNLFKVSVRTMKVATAQFLIKSFPTVVVLRKDASKAGNLMLEKIMETAMLDGETGLVRFIQNLTQLVDRLLLELDSAS